MSEIRLNFRTVSLPGIAMSMAHYNLQFEHLKLVFSAPPPSPPFLTRLLCDDSTSIAPA